MILKSTISIDGYTRESEAIIKLFFGEGFSVVKRNAGIVDVCISGETDYLNYQIPRCVKYLQDHGDKVVRTTCRENKEFYRHIRDFNNYIEGNVISIGDLTFLATNNINNLFHKKVIGDISADVPNSIVNEYTKGMVETIYEYIKPSTAFLDIGCGKGLVCMAATALGAWRSTGIDIDPYHIKIAKESAYRYNKIEEDRIKFFCNDIFDVNIEDYLDEYDVITCNLTAPIIKRLMETKALNSLLSQRGTVILGGFNVFSEESIVKTIMKYEKIHGLYIDDVKVIHEYGDVDYIILKRRYQL